MKSYYEFHEQAYQNIKSNGYISWDRSTDIDEILPPETEEFLMMVIQSHFPIVQDLMALDLGCGTGTSSFYFAKKGFKTTGIDISATAIELAQNLSRQQDLEVDFKVGDVLYLKGLGQKFDLIYDSHCLHCIVFDEDRKKVLHGIHDILNPSGIFALDTMVFSESMNLNPENNEFLKFDQHGILWHRTKDASAHGVIEENGTYWCAQRRLLSEQEILAEVKACGFKVLTQNLDPQSAPSPAMLRLTLALEEARA